MPCDDGKAGSLAAPIRASQTEEFLSKERIVTEFYANHSLFPPLGHSDAMKEDAKTDFFFFAAVDVIV